MSSLERWTLGFVLGGLLLVFALLLFDWLTEDGQ